MTRYRGLRLTVLSEDRRTEIFARQVLTGLGVQRPQYVTAPAGINGCLWVQQRYGEELKKLRAKNYQENLGLLCINDGDATGVDGRKVELNGRQSPARQPEEKVAIWVPTWSIETWLLSLLGHPELDETQSYKATFEKNYKARPSKQPKTPPKSGPPPQRWPPCKTPIKSWSG